MEQTLTAQPLCAGIRDDGQPCRALAMHGSTCCYQHDPATEADRQLPNWARQGRPRGAPILDEPCELETVADIEALLRRTALYLATATDAEARRATALNGIAGRLLDTVHRRRLQEELESARDEIERLRAENGDMDQRGMSLCLLYDERGQRIEELTRELAACRDRLRAAGIDRNLTT